MSLHSRDTRVSMLGLLVVPHVTTGGWKFVLPPLLSWVPRDAVTMRFIASICSLGITRLSCWNITSLLCPARQV